MKKINRIFAVALLLAIGIISSQCGCAIPTKSQVKIKTDQIHLQSPAKSTLQYQITPIVPYEYVYNHKQTFSNTPSTAFGIGGFDFNPSSTGEIQSTIAKKEQSASSFKIAVNYNSNWQSIKVGFLSTDRPDIEIGEASITGPVPTDTFTLKYKFKNQWTDANYLRYKVFITGFSLKTNQQNILRVSLQKADVSSSLITLLYSTKQSATIIDSFSVSLVIFDGYNPAFRFSQGVVTQSFVATKVSVSVPRQGVSEVRNAIAGLTSFEVASVNIAVSLNTNFNSDFSLELGPTQNNCQINLLSISYLILSVYSDCGACYPNLLFFNDKCVDNCPNGYYVTNGRCEPKTCQAGFYLFGNNCVKCPRHSDIKQCNNACPAGTKLVGQDCAPICTAQNEVYSYGSCVCADGLFRINGRCTRCQKGTKYDYCSKTCVSICPSYSVYLPETDLCRCNDGYNMFHGRCVKCASNQVFDNTWGCHLWCPDNYVFNGKDCVCAYGFNLLPTGCGKCREDEVYHPIQKACRPRCSIYQIWQANTCGCVAGYYRINGVCQPCGVNQVYEPTLGACRTNCANGQVWVGGKCQCLPGSYFINNNCQICSVEKVYDPSTQQCQKICKQQYQYFNNGKCLCLRSYQRGQAGDCRPKVCPQNAAYNYGADTCICNIGYVLSSKTGQCEKIPTCPPYSAYINGYCVCNNGWFMNVEKTACIQCDASRYEVYNGQRCVCIDGYVAGSDGRCSKIVIPTCGANQYFDPVTKNCFCNDGCEKINGVCFRIPTCKSNEYWNGKACTCSTGFTYNPKTSTCDPVVPIPPPNCPYNSHFNGVKCVCNERFFEYSAGVCATCPPLMTWNGKKCAYGKDCWAGYKWDAKTQCCVAIGPACPPHSKWNGQACQCDKGYNAVGSGCIKCQKGFQFDGSKCSRVPKPLQCNQINTVPVQGKCVCRDGTHLYNGDCIECTYPTVWNGYYCQGNVDACLSVPNSKLDPVTRRCGCIIGYRAAQGTCIPIPGYLYQNGNIYTWDAGYRWAGGPGNTNPDYNGGYGGHSDHNDHNDGSDGHNDNNNHNDNHDNQDNHNQGGNQNNDNDGNNWNNWNDKWNNWNDKWSQSKQKDYNNWPNKDRGSIHYVIYDKWSSP